MTAFMGMRGTGDWVTDERPKNWREGILYLYPNGTAPLTAIMSKLGSQRVDDPEFNWWTKTLAQQGGAVTNVYTDVGLTTPYVSGGVAGDTLYVNLAEAVADEFRTGHQALLRDASDLTVDVNAKVTNVVKNGASSYLAVRLLEADDNSVSNDISNVDNILIVGNINAEGAPMPDSVVYNPTKYYNYTQIFRTPLSITRTARKTRLRTRPAYQEAKREALEYHSIEIEKAIIFGIATENTGSNGKPERTTGGLINAIRTNAADNVDDYAQNTDYTGDSWLASGETWLDEQLEQIFRYGSMEKMAFVGSGALLGINRLAKTGAQINITPMTTSYGLRVMEWITPFGTIFMKTHPLFSFEATNRNSMLIIEPPMLKWRFIDDTHFIPDDGRNGRVRTDSTEEEYLTEAGLEWHHAEKMGFLSGIGTDNAL